MLGHSDVMLSGALRRDTTALHKTSAGSVAVPLPRVAALRGTPVGPSRQCFFVCPRLSPTPPASLRATWSGVRDSTMTENWMEFDRLASRPLLTTVNERMYFCRFALKARVVLEIGAFPSSQYVSPGPVKGWSISRRNGRDRIFHNMQ